MSTQALTDMDLDSILYRARAIYEGPCADVPREVWLFDELHEDLPIAVVNKTMQVRACRHFQVHDMLIVEDALPVAALQANGKSQVLPHRWLELDAPHGRIEYITPGQSALLFRRERTAQMFAEMHVQLMTQVVADVVQWRAAVLLGETPVVVFVPRAELIPVIGEMDADDVATLLPGLLNEAMKTARVELDYTVRAVQTMSDVREFQQGRSLRPDPVGISYAWAAMDGSPGLWPDDRCDYSLLPPALADYMSAVRCQLDALPVCETMGKPKHQCGCPDCGSSLIS